MVLHIAPNTVHGKKRVSLQKINVQNGMKKERIESGSLKNLFSDSLKRMAYILNPGMCGKANHYDCVMHLKVTGENAERLLVEFLEKTLELVHLHKIIFCSVNFVEFSEKKLVAQLFGVRLDCFHTDIKSIAPKNCMVERDDQDGYAGSIVFNLELAL